MKIMRMNDLPDNRSGHILKGIVKGEYIYRGGLSFAAPGARAHSDVGPGGSDRHVHDDCEIFVMLSGRAQMEKNGQMHPLCTGDVCIVEPGEDHHIINDQDDPGVYIWFHAGSARNEAQKS